MNDKPTPPDGYEVMLGKDLPSPIPDQTMFWCVGEWEVSDYCGDERLTNEGDRESWYAHPILEDSTSQKDPIGTDPKGEIGKTKAPMWLLPSTALIETAWAMGDGASKYRPYNWRETKVCASTYISAMMRHWAAYLDGEDRAEDSKCHHLAHIVANCNILMDAAKCGTLVDDRPKMPK